MGAGRKPKSDAEKRLTGSRRVAHVLPHPSAPVPAEPPIGPPKDLQEPAKLIWAELAPHATKAQTLTAGTAAAFAMLCRAVVLERVLAASALAAGGADHRGMMQRVATGFKDFGIAPFGKPVHGEDEAEKPVSALERLLQRRRG